MLSGTIAHPLLIHLPQRNHPAIHRAATMPHTCAGLPLDPKLKCTGEQENRVTTPCNCSDSSACLPSIRREKWLYSLLAPAIPCALLQSDSPRFPLGSRNFIGTSPIKPELEQLNSFPNTCCGYLQQTLFQLLLRASPRWGWKGAL